jgi:branched-chain amino acid aminotransferase
VKFESLLAGEEKYPFTTFRSWEEKNSPRAHFISLLDRHLERLNNACKELKIKVSLERSQILALLKEAIKNSPTSTRIRLVIVNGSCKVFCSRYAATWESEKAIKLVSFQGERDNLKLKLTGAKSISLIARQFAKKNSADEALLIDKLGYVREGAWSNFFWFDKSGVLKSNISYSLPGVTAQAISQIKEIKDCQASLDEILCQAEEIFVTQATTLITPVGQIDHRKINSGEKTAMLLKKLQALLKSEREKL